MKRFILAFFLITNTLMASHIIIKEAYVRATPPGLPNSAAFMHIENKSSDDIALIGAKSAIANAVELHTHEMKNGAMHMYQIPKIDIKAESQTVLKPGGLHIMLLGLTKKPLQVGQSVDIELMFSNKQSITISLPVKSIMGGMMKHKNMQKGSCGQGKCGTSMQKPMPCGQGKCGSN